MEETKKPAIRFDGFAEDWEKQPLSAFSNKVSEKNTNNQYAETFTNSAEFGVISQRDFFDHDISNAENINGYYIVKSDDFVYNPRISVTAPCGPINRNKLGRSGVMSPLYTVFRTNDVNKLFLEWYFKSDYWHSYMYFNGDSGARSDRFSIKNDLFFQMPIPVPSTEEQQQIGFALDKINDTITLHQQKYDKLLAFKKSMLEKMFPQNGAKVPEVRFAGFDGAWVEYRFGDIVAKYSDSVATPKNGYTRLGIRSHGKGTFHSAVLPGMELETAQMHRVAANNFIVNITFGWEHAVAITDENDEGKLVSHRFPQYSFNEGAIPKFFKYLILDEKFRQHLELASPGGAGRNRVLKLDDMLEYQFMLPSVPEQESIADYLIKLDDLIQLKQSELEKLKNIKSALLERMFV